MDRECSRIYRRIFLLLSLLIISLTFSLALAADLEIVKNPQDLPGKLSSLARNGDYLIKDGKYLLLLGVEPRDFPAIKYYPCPPATGAILTLAPAGDGLDNEIIAGPIQLRIGFDYYYPAYKFVKIPKTSNSQSPYLFELQADFTGKHQEKGKIKTTYHYFPEKGQILIKSIFQNTGEKEINDLNLSLYFNAFHSYHFNPYNSKFFPDLNFRVYQKNGIYLGWINLGSKPVEIPKKVLPGQTIELNYALLVRKNALELLTSIYSLLKKEVVQAEISLGENKGKTSEIIVEEVLSSSTFFRSFVDNHQSVQFLLPEGFYRIRANFFPAVAEKIVHISRNGENRFELEKPAEGLLKITLMDKKGKALPGKISFFGLEGTRTPYFEPENPVQSGRNWEKFKNSIYAIKQPLEIKLPVGKYLVSASYGPFYTSEKQIIEIFAGREQELSLQLKKVIELKGYISLDPHLHTINSDGSLSVAERIKSIVAENLDVAIATDHNFVTDYQPVEEELGLTDYLRVFTGTEVTPLNSYLHFNNYPLKIRPEEKTRGSIITSQEKVKEMLTACRQKNPHSLLQLNHPRAGNLGYFNNTGLDPEKAAFATGDLELGFDLLEVMNGASFYQGNEQAIADWLHLLNRGYFFAAVGSSDSHGADGGEPGYSRVFLRCAKKLKELTFEDIALPLKKGQSFVSNGPVVDFRVNRRYQPGDLLTDRDGKIKARVRVLSAPWINVSEVRVIINGERKITFPVLTPDNEVKKFDKKLEITLDKDAYLIIEVLGQKSLYPVVQQPAASGRIEAAALPYAVTNPIFIDVDGNGRFDPPWPEKIEIKK